MVEWLFGGAAAWFSVPAILGTALFVLKGSATLIGGEAEVDLDADAHGGDAFKLLSVQTIAAFAMGFGWIGLAGYRGAEMGLGTSAVLAVGGGCGAAYAIAWAIAALYRLQSSGNVAIEDLMGREAQVELTVPPARTGRGELQAVVSGQACTYACVTDEAEPITRGVRVRVIGSNADNTLTVARS